MIPNRDGCVSEIGWGKKWRECMSERKNCYADEKDVKIGIAGIES